MLGAAREACSRRILVLPKQSISALGFLSFFFFFCLLDTATSCKDLLSVTATAMKPTLSTKQFYLLGEDPATKAQEIDVPSSSDESELRSLIASHFAIVDAKGARLMQSAHTQQT